MPSLMLRRRSPLFRCFFFNDTATTEIYTLSLHDALPISLGRTVDHEHGRGGRGDVKNSDKGRSEEHTSELQSHSFISYAVFCLKKQRQRQRGAGTRGTAPLREAGGRGAVRLLHARGNEVAQGDVGSTIVCDRLDVFFFNDTATTEIYPLSLHDALPICTLPLSSCSQYQRARLTASPVAHPRSEEYTSELQSHSFISYAVFCLKKKH